MVNRAAPSIPFAALLLLCSTACGTDPGNSTDGSLEQAIVNGFTNVPNRPVAVGFANFETPTLHSCSGWMWRGDVGVSNGHCLARPAGGPGTFLVYLQDLTGSSASTFRADTIVVHPTYAGPDSADPVVAADVNQSLGTRELGADLAMFVTHESVESPSRTTPQTIHEEAPGNTILDRTDGVEIQGYADVERRTLVGTVVGTRDITLAGFNNQRLARAFVTDGQFVSGVGKQRTEPGDSGSPVMVRSTTAIAGTHFAHALQGSLSVEMSTFAPWVDIVTETRRPPVMADVDGKGRKDQVFFVPSLGNCLQHIEFGEGIVLRQRKTLPIICPEAPIFMGSLNGPAADDVVALEDGEALVLFDVLADDPPTPTVIGGSVAYTALEPARHNYDDFEDIRAVRADGGSDFLFGSEQGLAGPFPATNAQSCRAVFSDVMGNACGSRAQTGTCWCDAGCSARGDCCADVVDACQDPGGTFVSDPLARIATALLDPTPRSVTSLALPAPIATVDAGMGVFLEKQWFVTLASALGTAPTPASVDLRHQGETVPVEAVLVHPEADLALLRISTEASIDIPAGQALEFYSGTASELDAESDVFLFGALPSTGDVAAVAVLREELAALERGRWNDPARFLLARSGAVESQLLDARPGAPVTSRNARLAGLVKESETHVVPVRTPAGAEASVAVTVSEVQPLLKPTGDVGASRPNPVHWIEQVRQRTRLRDFGGDGNQDLWGQRGNEIVSFRNLVPSSFRFSSEPTPVAPAQTLPGAWRFVSRAELGPELTVLIWREGLTGAINIWKVVDGSIAEQLSFFVTPDWDLHAVGDLNGDQIGDFVWKNELFGLHYFWMMHDFVKVFGGLSGAQTNLAGMVRISQWFGGLGFSSDDVPVDIAAAEYFDPLTELDRGSTGAEQAALDLVWRAPGSAAALLWEMTTRVRPCEDIADARIRENCPAGQTGFTYEMSRNAFALEPQPAYWQLVGSADYDADGRPDLVWHATGEDAGAELGQVELWLSRANGTFDRVRAQGTLGDPLVVDPTTTALNVR
ncbi:MAG: trypsin-like serine protease [Pseudomonadota bacterium]